MRKNTNLKLSIIFLFFLSVPIDAQNVIKKFDTNIIASINLPKLKREFGKNKNIAKAYETQILIALSYFPELKNVPITFVLKKTETPLSSRPSFIGLLQSAKNRKYTITISDETNSKLEPILFKNLNLNAQIGIIGHELSHVSDYMEKGFGKMSSLLWIEIFSKKEVDKFEYKTDLRCINHGLGYQLLEWSKSVRSNLKIDYWRGADNLRYQTKRERYLNPETIIKTMKSNVLYGNGQIFQ